MPGEVVYKMRGEREREKEIKKRESQNKIKYNKTKALTRRYLFVCLREGK